VRAPAPITEAQVWKQCQLAPMKRSVIDAAQRAERRRICEECTSCTADRALAQPCGCVFCERAYMELTRIAEQFDHQAEEEFLA
jgi:hypothetical protein